MQLIQVLYLNDRGGPVDDITLDELIRSQKIRHFYRPSEDRWVDIFIDPVRKTGEVNTAGCFRRASDVEEKEGQQDEREKPKPRGLFSGLFKRRRTVITPKKQLGAHEWFEKGLLMLRTTGDRVRAARAFALSIRLNPRYQEAYLHRGLVYEALGNLQQAIEDYGMAVSLDPKEGKAHNVRGLVLEHPDMTVKAIAGLRRAADLQRAPAQTLLRSPAELREAWEAFTERHRDEGKVGDTGTGGPLEAAENLQRLIEKYKKEITQLEAQVKEIEHKHDILVEAARLLQEEVLAPHRSQYEELSDMHTKKGSHCSQP